MVPRAPPAVAPPQFLRQTRKPTKPYLLVLRPKPGNPPPPWFWGSTKKSTTGFEAKPGTTVATGFEAKPEKTDATGFEAKLEKIIVIGFEVKPLTNRRPWFRGSTK
jgi:hypothetical protein